jgi:Uma2 family endonuclease
MKLSLYERHGVREYWVIDPGNRYVQVYVRGEGGRYPDPELFVAIPG